MPSKRVRLYIDSDASGVQKGVGQAQRSLRGFEGQAKRSQSVMGGLSTSASSLGLAFGAAGLAVGIKSSIDAFKEQEKSTAKVIAQLKTLGVNTAAVRKQIEDTTKAQSKLSGIQDEELQASFTSILRVTGDVNKSLKLNALAMDISKGSGKGLGVVATALAKVLDGNVAALGRYGVKAQKGATITDVLALAQKRYAGQAKEFGNTTAGAADKANAQINELQESIGGKLAPAMNEAAGATIKFAGATQSLIDHAGGLGPVLATGAGFGAFKLLGPSIVNAGSALGQLSRVAGKQGAGASFRVLGSAIGSSINPITAAAVGAGLLAGGIYEIWHNSENAAQAVGELNKRMKDVQGARDQVTAAKDNVAAAKDYVNTTKQSVAEARAYAAQLTANVNHLKEHKGTTAQVEAAQKKANKAWADVIPLAHSATAAEHQLVIAHRNVTTASDGVAVEQARVSQKLQDVINKANAAGVVVHNTGGRWSAFTQVSRSAARSVDALAGTFEAASRAAHGTDTATSRADATIAKIIRTMGRVPTKKEFRLITNLASEGEKAAAIVRQLGLIHDKSVTVRFNQTFGARVNPLTGLRTTKPATGAFVAGDYSRGDRVPALLSGGEAVLNPKQIALVDSGMSVMGALDATGAPVIGQGFASGRHPIKPEHRNPKYNPPNVKPISAADRMADRIDKALARKLAPGDLRSAQIAVRIAEADARGDAAGNVLAYQADLGEAVSDAALIRMILANPAKALGIKGAKLTNDQRVTLLGTLASLVQRAKGDEDTIFGLQHPASDDTSGGDTGAGDTPTAYDATADLQAQVAQKETIIANLTRSNNLSGAALTAFGSSGDIGTGNFSNAMTAAKGGPMLVLGDFRSVAAVAGAAAQGFGNQPSISANAASVRV